MSIAQVEIDRYFRKGGKEFRQQGRHMQQPERHGCCQPHHPTRHRCLRPRGVFGCFALGDDGQFEPVRDLRLAIAASGNPRFWILEHGEGRSVPPCD